MRAVPTPDVSSQRWEAVLRKDREWDGEFVYAVRTTGIYCRPSCPAKPAKRANVAFFETGFDAAAAGYRACKRCKPDGIALEHRHCDIVEAACRRIAASEAPVSVIALAAEAGVSTCYFHRLFKAVVGVTPKDFYRALLRRKAAACLAAADSVTAAIYEAGYSSSSRFYEGAGADLGMTPQDFLKGAEGMIIRYTIAPCPMGAMILAASDRGPCAIEIDRNADDLVGLLRQRFPKAQIERAGAEFDVWVADILAKVSPARNLADLSWEIQGLAYQSQVWNAAR